MRIFKQTCILYMLSLSSLLPFLLNMAQMINKESTDIYLKLLDKFFFALITSLVRVMARHEAR